MKAIILTPPDRELSNADCVAWVQRERDILADDIAAEGGRLIAATAFVWPREPSAFRALMLTCKVKSSIDIEGACSVARGMMAQLIGEAAAFARARNAATILFEWTFGSEALGRSDAEAIYILPAMTEAAPGRLDFDR